MGKGEARGGASGKGRGAGWGDGPGRGGHHRADARWARARRWDTYFALEGNAVRMDGLLKGEKVSPQDGRVDVVDRRQSAEARVAYAGVS